MNFIKSAGKWLVKSKIKAISLTVIALFCAATIYAAASYSSTVTINIDGIENRITTLKTDAYEIIAQAGIEIADTDVVDLSGFQSGLDSVIKINRAYSVTVFDNGKDGVKVLANGTAADVLKKANITLKDGDLTSCTLDSNIYDGMEIAITRAFPVMISADGEIVTVNMAGGTVSDALDKAVITVDDDDELSAPLDSILTGGMSVKISRVSYKERTQDEELAYETVKKNDSTLYVGQSKVTTKGVKGTKKVTYRDKYVDGKLTESIAANTVVTKAAVNEVKLVGTKKKAVSTSTSTAGAKLANGISTISRLTPPASLTLNGNVPTSYKRKLVGTASAYSGGGVTATGRGVMPGYIAVNPNQIPYHSKMWIVSNDGKYVYGYASAEDTGGFTKWTGSRATLCDLYFATMSQASAFGRRSVTIYVL